LIIVFGVKIVEPNSKLLGSGGEKRCEIAHGKAFKSFGKVACIRKPNATGNEARQTGKRNEEK